MNFHLTYQFVFFDCINMLVLSVFSLILVCCGGMKYEPNWDSLDSRPLPLWFDESKVGIFIHWGVFSVPSFKSEWFWKDWKDNDTEVVDYMKKYYAPDWQYQDFAKDFTAEFFDPAEWADIFANAGAKYVVLTSKHHEGYTLWPSKYSYSWNVKDVGPGRDVIGDLATAVRAKDLKFGLYHSYLEWYNDMYLADKATNFVNTEFIDHKIYPELKELVNTYKPSIVWSDGDWEASDTYWKSKEFLTWLYNESPVKDEVVVNDRWGQGTPCEHGGYFSCKDRFNPGTLQQHKWENAMTLDMASWGFRRNAKLVDYMTISELLKQLASTVSCGGNILINIGPTKDGIIAPIYQQVLKDLGTWLSINGEAIYSTKPWTSQNDTLDGNVWYTSKGTTVYAISLGWPENNTLSLGAAVDIFKDPQTSVQLLGNENESIQWTLDNDLVNIQFPDKATIKSEWAYVVAIIPPATVNVL